MQGLRLVQAKLHNNIGVSLHRQERYENGSHHYQKSIELRAEILQEKDGDISANEENENELLLEIRSLANYASRLRTSLEQRKPQLTRRQRPQASSATPLPFGMRFFQDPLYDDDIEMTNNTPIASIREKMEDGDDGSSYALFNLAMARYHLGVDGSIASQLFEMVVTEADRALLSTNVYQSTRKPRQLHLICALALNNIGMMQYTNGFYGKAMELFLAALQKVHDAASSSKKGTRGLGRHLSSVLINLSYTYARRGLLVQAAEICKELEKEATSPSTNALEEHYRLHCSIYFLKAELHREKGDLTSGKTIHRGLYDQVLGGAVTLDDQTFVELVDALGRSFLQQGGIERAKRSFAAVLSKQCSTLGDRHLCVAGTLFNLGRALHDEESFEDAVHTYEQALSIQKENLPFNHIDIIDTSYNLGMVFFLQGRNDDSLKMHINVHNIATTSLPQDHPLFLRLLKNIYLLLRESGDENEAEFVLRNILQKCQTSEEAVWVSNNLIDQGAVLRPFNRSCENPAPAA